LIASCSNLNAQIMRTMATRVGHLQQMAVESPIATVKLIGHRFDLACHALRDFLARNRVSFRWHDIHDPEARAGLASPPDPDEAYPVVVLPDGTRLTTPSFRAVAERLGLQTKPSDGRYDVAIVGAGPAGLAAAVYGASEGLRTILIERHAPADKPARRHESKIIWAFRPALPATNSATARCSRPSGSAPKSSSHATSSA
jgi:hypothetical protein